MQQKFVLIGCGGHARSVANCILDKYNDAEIFFVDENAKDNEKILGYPVVKFDEKLNYAHIAIGDNNKRKAMSSKVNRQMTIISKYAFLGKETYIADGCFLGYGAYVGPQTLIGNSTIVNTYSVVEHNCTIGNFCHIAPRSVLCGGVVLGNNVFIGAGAIIKNNIKIGSDIIIGAGAVVVNDINEKGVYIGCPAMKIKE